MTKTHLEHIALLLRLVLITFFTLIFTELCIVRKEPPQQGAELNKSLIPRIEEHEQLDQAVGIQSQSHLVEQFTKLQQVQHAVSIRVCILEKCLHILAIVAPLQEALAHPGEKENLSPHVPGCGELMPYNSNRQGEEEHGDGRQNGNEEVAGHTLRRIVPVSDSGHGDDRKPDCVCQAGDVRPDLHEVDDSRRGQRNQNQSIKEDRQCLH
mmetsp:Transcript_4481/g.10455  ORF Transcript_4481/g.10455 Transcript_4481/m.10455 type:complete len:210 (-) Transcript_4481:405-1034(-)